MSETIPTSPGTDKDVPAPAHPEAAPTENSTPQDTNSRPKQITLSKKVIGIAAAVLVAALALGVVVGYVARNSEVSNLSTDLADAKAQIQLEIAAKKKAKTAASEEADKIIAQERALLEDREAALEEQQALVAEREEKVTAAEAQQAANQFGGGVHTVGVTISAGTYTTTVTSGMCYYAWKDGTGAAASIIDNNIVESGPATVTLQDGQTFESSGCGTWKKA